MSWSIIEGDARDRLGELASGSVQTCVTSPPYWGLRDYGTATWEGGDAECDHTRDEHISTSATSTLGVPADGGPRRIGAENSTTQFRPFGGTCGKCGATRIDSQLGLELTPELYVANLVEVFREVRRVLRDDGTLWLNLGDSYASSPPGNKATGVEKWRTSGLHGAVSENYAKTLDAGVSTRRSTVAGEGVKPKDLVGIPWMVAFALRADGWYLRSDVIWSKPNPMPESVTDRPTKAHEYLFLLSKSPRYYYDADAVREELAASTLPRLAYSGTGAVVDASRHDALPDMAKAPHPGGANKRSVWTVTTTPFPGAHFATFPPKLIEPCILAGSAEGDTVLDPFAGAGTTGLVALRHNRSFIGIELNPEYAQMARDRIYQDAPLLNVEDDLPQDRKEAA